MRDAEDGDDEDEIEEGRKEGRKEGHTKHKEGEGRCTLTPSMSATLATTAKMLRVTWTSATYR
jgi:hypothetical protein